MTGKTIFLNSHMLSEVELVCDHVVILNQGLVARAATPEEFTRGTGEYLVRVAEVSDAVRAAAASIAGEGEWHGTTLRLQAARPRSVERDGRQTAQRAGGN